MTAHTFGSRHDWTLVLPVKGGPDAKSRLDAPGSLAEAIALDTLDAVVACACVATVVVVTADDRFAALAARGGAAVWRERRPGAGLNAAVRDALAHSAAGSGPMAVLLADVPALRPQDLGSALRRLGLLLHQPGSPANGPAGWAVVPDAEGSGTVLIAGTEAAALRPAFGAGSAAAHEARGALRVDLDCPRLRCDVDTPADLERARELGVGPHTAAALGALAPLGPIP